MAKISKDMTIGELIAMDTNIIGILMGAGIDRKSTRLNSSHT